MHEIISIFVIGAHLQFTSSHTETAENTAQFDSVTPFCTVAGGIYYISVFTCFRAVIHFVERIACGIYYCLLVLRV
jgi:hypothetical protein